MTDHPFASLDNYMLTREYIKACIREEVANTDPALVDEDYRARHYPLADVASEFTLADVITEALNRGLTMNDLEEMSIQLGY
jgi:hypothetical protein